MKTKLIEVKNLKEGNPIFYMEEHFLIERITQNRNNKHFLFIHTTSNKKIELPKEAWVQKIMIF